MTEKELLELGFEKQYIEEDSDEYYYSRGFFDQCDAYLSLITLQTSEEIYRPTDWCVTFFESGIVPEPVYRTYSSVEFLIKAIEQKL